MTVKSTKYLRRKVSMGGMKSVSRVMYQLNQSLIIPPPPGITRAFDVFSCPGGREFDELVFPGEGHSITTHRGWEI